MKMHNIVILFIIIFSAVFSVFEIRQQALNKVTLQKSRYDSIMENAIDCAAECLVIKDSGDSPFIQKEEAVDVLFHSLYAGFGILDDVEAQEQLKLYIPVIMVVGYDGCYFWYHDTYDNHGTNIVEQWSERIPFQYYDSTNKKMVDFTINDLAYLYDDTGDFSHVATREDLKLLFPSVGLFSTEEEFNEIRRTTITDIITNRMNYYINNYNMIASNYGINYEFSIPYFDDNTWARTIDDVSIVMMLQNYPYGTYTTMRYNSFQVSGARVKKSDKYSITNESGTLYYHNASCEHYDESGELYDSCRECALLGAYPCDCVK